MLGLLSLFILPTITIIVFGRFDFFFGAGFYSTCSWVFTVVFRRHG